MKENKVKLPLRTPRTPRTKKRKRRRTISSSSSGVQTGSESDRTIFNDDNKTVTHDKLQISQNNENCSKQEPERKKLKTVEEDSKDVEDSDVNRASSPSDPIAKHGTDSICNVKEFKDISSVDITSSQDDSSDYPVAPTEDPLTLDIPSNTHVADTRFANVPVRQLQKNNRARKSYTGKDIKQSEQKSGQKSTQPQRQAARKAETQIKVLAEQDSIFTEELEQQVSEEATQICYQCCRIRVCNHQVTVNRVVKKICSEECVKVFQAKGDKINKEITPEIANRHRKCRQCQIAATGSENNLAWETMDFCQEECLAKFQKDLGGFCCFCKSSVSGGSLGKYCVRFGFDIRQFCGSTCLEEFKKGLKVCCYCQKDISGGSEGFLAPVGDRGQFKEFCSQKCMEKYDYMSGNKKPPPVIHQCTVCNNEKLVTIEVMLNGVYNQLCSEPCFAAFKFVNRIIADQCNVCRKYFDLSNAHNYVAYYDEVPRRFCCRTCMNVFILANRRIVPCNWCKVKKYNFDMIKRVTARGVHLLMCSLNCLALYQYSVSATPTKRMLCDMCSVFTRMQYHLAMSDSSIRNFCSCACVMKFQEQYKNSTGETLTASTPIPTGGPTKAGSHKNSTSAPANDLAQNKGAAPVISAVTSL
ncbi:LOW QUALITY PROTEIN: zinc finger MYM-type protein 3-like [Schistocerca gregaria]|uniref:LOW QUALITY PROTEIN: zinc finger MYM-type protein 3-like n=1 Tax=Schistocerca gregaria TaxID=7010 RepID=UPI00211E2809|nr:LOW QUALITY PROTEIN: zinc finger MYM-type protein 3-like [Schistocerca gregaria]